MGSKLLKGTLIGGGVAWIWYLLSWAFLPWHCDVMQKFTNETEVASVIANNTPYSGIYYLPAFCSEGKFSKTSEDFEKGPIVFAAIKRYGTTLSVKSFLSHLLSLLVQWAGAFFIFLVLLHARHRHYGSKLAMATFIGIIVGILGAFPNWVFWGFPFPYVFVTLCDNTIAWFLAGLFMAAFASPGKMMPSEITRTENLPPPQN